MKIIELNKTYVIVETEPEFGNKFSEKLAKIFNANQSTRIKYFISELVDGSFIYTNEFGVLKKTPYLDTLILSHPNNPFIKVSSKINIPKGWFVYEAGQSPLHLLWFVNLVNINEFINGSKHPTQIYVEEEDSFESALNKAVKQLNKLR